MSFLGLSFLFSDRTRGLLLCVVLPMLLAGCMSDLADPDLAHRELAIYDRVDLMPFFAMIPEKPFTETQQASLKEKYSEHWFRPWGKSLVVPDKSQPSWGISYISETVLYRENKRSVDALFLKKITAEMNLDAFPNADTLAVSVRYTHLKYIPDHGSLFETPDDFPFDVLQVTSVGPGTPLRIWHVSRDGLWVYVSAPFASGWVSVLDIATMTAKDTAWVMSLPMYAVMKDSVVAVSLETQRPVLDLSLGQHYPGVMGQRSQVYVPIRQSGGQARWSVVAVEDAMALQPFGVTWSRQLVAQLAMGVMGEPYGWGGLFFHRDCSALMRDFLAPFGIWLPRNSAAQAKYGGRYESLSMMTNEEKTRAIVGKGRPFLTLLWLKGHVMLYVGSPQGEPMALHNIWGVRVRDRLGQSQKVIIGRTVITDLEPGKSLPGFDLTQSLLSRIEGMTFLGE